MSKKTRTKTVSPLEQLKLQHQALSFEGLGLRFKASVLSSVKKQHGLTGTRTTVLRALKRKIEALSDLQTLT